MTETPGFLLGGRVRYAQYADGYRTGIEPVLLAAAIPARPGQSVLELGAGAGAATLCLLARVPTLRATAVEVAPDLAALAGRNLAANGLQATVLQADIAGLDLPPVHHAFANPPWHDPASTLPPDAAKARAKHRAATGLAPWVDALCRSTRPGGTVTLALPASLLGEALSLLQAARRGRTTILPLWPRPGRPARLLLLQARRGPAQTRLAPGLVLHEGRAYTAEAEAILRAGAALPV